MNKRVDAADDLYHKPALLNSFNTAKGTTLDTYGTAQLDLRINNKSSAAFGQITIQWLIVGTLL